ncbi:hypothetical protein [Caudoviricetes sp.]|nr:hypothetical protein [Caudoviricetes sp.]
MTLPRVTFTTEPTLQRASGGRYQLTTPLVANVAGLTYKVPAGFVTDGASVPAVFWTLVSNPYAPSSLRPALLHDWMCRQQGHHLTSAQVHRVFYAALLREGCAPLRAWCMYVAVRWFGPKW